MLFNGGGKYTFLVNSSVILNFSNCAIRQRSCNYFSLEECVTTLGHRDSFTMAMALSIQACGRRAHFSLYLFVIAILM